MQCLIRLHLKIFRTTLMVIMNSLKKCCYNSHLFYRFPFEKRLFYPTCLIWSKPLLSLAVVLFIYLPLLFKLKIFLLIILFIVQEPCGFWVPKLYKADYFYLLILILRHWSPRLSLWAVYKSQILNTLGSMELNA